MDQTTHTTTTTLPMQAVASPLFLLVAGMALTLMPPALGIFYAGLSPRKNALAAMQLSAMLPVSISTLQWALLGFSLAFSQAGSSSFIGDMSHAALRNIDISTLPISHINSTAHLNTSSIANTTATESSTNTATAIFAFYQLQICTFSVALITGAFADRLRLLPAGLFIFLWNTLVYSPIAYWTWSQKGWLRNFGCSKNIYCGIGFLDAAGGGATQIASGFSGLAVALVLGRSSLASGNVPYNKPHNILFVVFSTGILLLVMGGSAGAASTRATITALSFRLAGAAGALSWIMTDYIRYHFTHFQYISCGERTENNETPTSPKVRPPYKISTVNFCCGVIAGLVVITPSAGYVKPWAALVIGLLSGPICIFGCYIKQLVPYFDDHLETFGMHGIGGFMGCLLTALFASRDIITLSDTSIQDVITQGINPVPGVGTQLLWQLMGSLVIAVWSFVMSGIILGVLSLLISVRVDDEGERVGLDKAEMGDTFMC